MLRPAATVLCGLLVACGLDGGAPITPESSGAPPATSRGVQSDPLIRARAGIVEGEFRTWVENAGSSDIVLSSFGDVGPVGVVEYACAQRAQTTYSILPPRSRAKTSYLPAGRELPEDIYGYSAFVYVIEQNAWKQASVEFAAINVDQRPEIHELEHARKDLPERSLSGTDRLLLFDLVLAWKSKPIPRVVGTTPNALVQDDPLSSVLVSNPTPIPLVPSAGEHFTYRLERETSLDHTPWFDLGPFVRRCGSGSLDPEAVEPLSATHLFDRCFVASRDLPSGTYRITIPYRQGERQGLLQASFESRSRPEIDLDAAIRMLFSQNVRRCIAKHDGVRDRAKQLGILLRLAGDLEAGGPWS